MASLAVASPLRSSPRAATFTVGLADGARTTVHASVHPLDSTELRVAVLDPATTLPQWCASSGVEDAIVGGFYVRATGMPLGELRTHGVERASTPFLEPWRDLRSCLHVTGGVPHVARRYELPPEPPGDLLQAGPSLVRGGQIVVSGDSDPEGFSAGSAQFDSDITDGRHPRAALGIAGGLAWAVVCDGRSRVDAGLTLRELAQLMAWLGVRDALNLDGGGSASLVAGGRLVNSPRDHHDAAPHGGRPISTAIAFVPTRRSGCRIQSRPDDLAASPW